MIKTFLITRIDMYTEEIKYGSGLLLSDEEIKLRCLEISVQINNVNALLMAKDLYKWVTKKDSEDNA